MIHNKLQQFIDLAKQNNATSFVLSTDAKVYLRTNNELKKLNDSEKLNKNEIDEIILSFLSIDLQKKLINDGNVECLFDTETNSKIKVQIFTHQDGLTATFNVIKNEIPDIEDFNFPDQILTKINNLDSGLVIFGGSPNENTSNLMASIINEINKTTTKHILYLNEETTFEFNNIKSLINQRKIQKNVENYESALKNILKEHFDIIVIEEIKDEKTLKIALNLSLSGYLVLAMMKADSTINTIQKCKFLYSNQKENELLEILASVLKIIIYKENQAFDILLNNHQISTLIRLNKLHQIKWVQEISGSEGMQTIERALKNIDKNINL